MDFPAIFRGCITRYERIGISPVGSVFFFHDFLRVVVSIVFTHRFSFLRLTSLLILPT